MTAIGDVLIITLIIYLLGIASVILLPKKLIPSSLKGFAGLASLSLLFVGFAALFSDSPYNASLWTIPNIGTLTITVDHLSAFFLIVTAIVAIPSSLFASAQMKNERGTHTGILAAIYIGLLITVIWVLIASDVFSFMVAWELMSILIYLIVISNREERPGYLMLAIGEAGTLAVLVALLLLAGNTGSLSFAGIKTGNMNLTYGLSWVIFILSFFGFGVKGGLIPVNFWLSRAYTSAPSKFIPFIAGATLNLGLYGIIRTNTYLMPMTNHPGPGIIMLLVGAITSLVGILYATIADDLKTLLAHSSIENAGIITTALGAGVLFLATGHRVPAAMAFIAAFYHLLNHSVFKTLLFMGVGSVENTTGIRSLDRMGGLIKKMPWTGLFVLVGVMSITAMPPFNGFVSEWLTLETLLRSVELASLGVKIAFIVAGATLALTAGLAVTCFVRAFAMGFLGMSRSKTAREAKEANRQELAPMLILALMCLLLGILPTCIIPALDRVASPLTGVSGTKTLVPPFFVKSGENGELPKKFVSGFHDIGAQVGQSFIPVRGLVVMHRGGKKNPVVFASSTSYMFLMLLLLFGICFTLVWFLAARHRRITLAPRWDGGVRRLLPEMSYTATGFAQPVRVIFDAIIRPRITNRREAIAEHFRVSIRRNKEEVHPVDRMVLYPIAAVAQRISALLGRMHSGKINAYAAYVLVVLVIFLIIASID